MAIQAQPGYITDPNNPNAVVRDPNNMGASTALAQNTGISIGATNPTGSPSPVPQTPVQTPVTQPQAPQTAPAGPTSTAISQTGTPVAGQAQTGLQMPANGSVVDLLNMAGQDSSYAARQQLAQQYGIANYQGTAQQNTELSKKYLEAYSKSKGTEVPQSAAQASSALDSYFQGSQQQQMADPQATFFDEVGSMNPVVGSLYDQINQVLSSPITTQTFADQYKQLSAEQGIPGLQTELMNIQNLMDGTEDSIREEITAAGGTANENQIRAMAAARNKTFLKQANQLQQQLALKQDYVNQVMAFTQADRAEVEKQVDRKLGLTTQLVELQDKMSNAAKENYTQLIDRVGYYGLAQALKNDPRQMANVEKLLGLGKGALSDPAFLGQEDAGKVLGSASTGYFTYNPFTGETTPIATGGSGGGGISSPTGGGVPTLTGKPLNDTQSVTLGYAQRLSDADKTIQELGSKFTGFSSYVGAILPNFLKTSERQQYEQAQRNFINAVLRKESGAAISPTEFDSAAKQYFPQPGDSQAVLNQKTANRARVIASLAQTANVPASYVTESNTSSGGSYQDYLNAIGQ